MKIVESGPIPDLIILIDRNAEDALIMHSLSGDKTIMTKQYLQELRKTHLAFAHKQIEGVKCNFKCVVIPTRTETNEQIANMVAKEIKSFLKTACDADNVQTSS